MYYFISNNEYCDEKVYNIYTMVILFLLNLNYYCCQINVIADIICADILLCNILI